jgi:hypothetical protein
VNSAMAVRDPHAYVRIAPRNNCTCHYLRTSYPRTNRK